MSYSWLYKYTTKHTKYCTLLHNSRPHYFFLPNKARRADHIVGFFFNPSDFLSTAVFLLDAERAAVAPDYWGY